MIEKRSGYPISLPLEVLGDSQSLIVIRDILFGNHRHFAPRSLPPYESAPKPDQPVTIHLRTCGADPAFAPTPNDNLRLRPSQ